MDLALSEDTSPADASAMALAVGEASACQGLQAVSAMESASAAKQRGELANVSS
ncbi:hypothetical protein ACM9XC_18590 [Xanthomonas sacchari]